MANQVNGTFAILSVFLLAGCAGGDPEKKAPSGKTDQPSCRSSELGRVTAASPLVSLGKRVAASEGATTPEVVVDGRYHASTMAVLPAPADDAPAWISIEVGTGPERLLVVWTDAGWTPYSALGGGAPTSYRIETSADSTDGSDGTWEIAVEEKPNVVRSRGDTLDFAGKSWVRWVATGVPDGAPNVRLDEIAVHDVTSAGPTDRPTDTWFFMGDSITQVGLQREFGADSADALVHEALPDYYPAIINGGIEGEVTSQGVSHLGPWLDEANPDFFHVGVLYGTNDSWGNKDPAATGFQTELEALVDGVLATNRVPFVATIPYATTAHDTLPAWNAVIETVVTERGLPCGPDFYGWFLAHPEDLSSDGVHPNTQGYRNMNRLWAETMQGHYQAE